MRMGQPEPKQFLKIKGKPIIVHTVEAFLHYDPRISITVVLSKDQFDAWREIYDTYLADVNVTLAKGGSTRFQSVRSGLSTIAEGLVAIHDAVRPMISSQIIDASYKSAEATGSGVVMVPLKDSIRKKVANNTQAEDRALFYAVQTPQTFRVDLIKRAFEQQEQPTFTDDASVYEAAGMTVTPVIGDYKNLKITTPEDLLIAEALM